MDCTAIRGSITYPKAYCQAFRHTHGVLNILPASDVIDKDAFELKDTTWRQLTPSNGHSLIGDVSVVAIAIVIVRARANAKKWKRQN
jgi:hypothetical protein